MANKFFQPGEQRAEKVKDLFAIIAPHYDLINDLQSLGLHRSWKRRLLEIAAPRPGERALDLCCGTGDVTRAFARRGVAAVGLDFSKPMIEVAAAKSKVQGPKAKVEEWTVIPVQLVRGDAQRLPFEAGSFDLVTVSYGLRNLANWRAGLEEMWRVAKPGGRLLVLDFGKPQNAMWRALYFAYLRCLVPLFGWAFCRDAQAYAYIYESLQHFPAQEGVAAAMRGMNCQAVRVFNLLGGVMAINLGRKAWIS
jgi:demethylmenaquinone methyltransferase/2-methoxy-6-polyprenyl-1,4-benzoquinol methylase